LCAPFQAAVEDAPQYPNVYISTKNAGLGLGGQKLALPIGTTRETMEVRLPACLFPSLERSLLTLSFSHRAVL